MNDTREARGFVLFKKKVQKSIPYYIIVLLPLAHLVIFRYIPMYGVQIAFKDFKASLGILGSPWIGLENFITFISSGSFWDIIRNTLVLSLYGLFAGMPCALILALALNECHFRKYVKTVQMVTYMPYFITTVVMVSMIGQFSDTRIGMVNMIINALGFESINFMGNKQWFTHIYVWTGIWQSVGYSAIIYLAALSGVSVELYDAAKVDGASKIRRIWHVDIPCILPTIVTLFVLSAGQIMNLGFEKVYLMQNSINISLSEVISTYVYKIGLANMNYSYSTAISFFNSIISMTLLILCNTISKRLARVTLW